MADAEQVGTIYDGLDFSKARDRVLALSRMKDALKISVKMSEASAANAKREPPSSAQLSAMWEGLAMVMQSCRALANIMAAEIGSR